MAGYVQFLAKSFAILYQHELTDKSDSRLHRLGELTMNVFEFALKMELDGKTYYEQLAEAETKTGLKKIFLGLAEDEQKHYETIQAMYEQRAVNMADSVLLEEAQNIFETLMAEPKTEIPLTKNCSAYQYAMTIEAKSQKFYEEMAEKENNPETIRLLLKIAEEEKKHFNIMDNIYTFMLAPYNFLAWGEFSNLTEYY
jgi:rubrerythrin